MSRRRNVGETKHSGQERWLITYADMITLLMIFFIVMYALSNVDAMKFRAMAASLSEVFGAGNIVYDAGPSIVEEGLNANAGPSDADAGGIDMQEIAQMQQIKKEIEGLIADKGLGASVSISFEERGLVVSFEDPVLFALGSDHLEPMARQIVNEVGLILSNTTNYIRVEGHTDDLPISTVRFPSNWELSIARANSVLKELIWGVKLAPERLSATGYGEYRPRVPNTSSVNRQLNRRVNIVVLNSKYDYSEPSKMSEPMMFFDPFSQEAEPEPVAIPAT